MKALYLPYRKRFLQDESSWGLLGKDSHGADFGVGVGLVIELAEQKLREWVLDSLLAAADDGEDRLDDLVAMAPRGSHLTFMPVDLVPIRLRLIRAHKHLTQAEVATKMGLTQQGYAKLERPGANLQLRTIQQVERALDEELLQLAAVRGSRIDSQFDSQSPRTLADNGGRRRTKGGRVQIRGGRRRTVTDGSSTG